jgi:hypothetical protein
MAMHDPAAAAAAAHGMPVPCTGLFAHAQSPAQIVAITGRAQRLLGDLAAHLNSQQQQQQQVDAASALTAWLQAALYLEVLSSGAAPAAASPAATMQAIATAKVAEPYTGTPDRPLVEQLLLLLPARGTSSMSAAAAALSAAGGSGGTAVAGVEASSAAEVVCVAEVVGQLQQGLSVVQGLAAAADQRGAVSCKGLLQSYLVARHSAATFPGDVSGGQWVAHMVMQLAELQ